MKGYIYKITNKLNNKVYIGQTRKTIEERFKEHCKIAFGNSKYKSYIHNALRKYGKDNFFIEIVDICNNLEELNSKEIYWINFFKSNENNLGYNLTSGGSNSTPNLEIRRKISESVRDYWSKNTHPFKGKKQSEEHKEKNRLSHLGNTWSDERKKDFSKRMSGENNPNYNKKFSDESKEKMSDAAKQSYLNGRVNPFFGKQHSEETKEKMRKPRSESAKQNMRKPKSESHIKNKSKKVLCIEENLEFDSIKNAALWLGKENYQSNISACCRGVINKAYGYHWRFV